MITPAITLLFDGDCPLCRREMAWLKRRDKLGRLGSEDIAAIDFDPRKYGKSIEQLMARIHGVLPDGTLVEGVEVFRRAYREIGLGWLLSWTGWPVLRWFADAAYRVFAKYRPRLPFRGNCAAGRCERPGSA